MTPQALSPCSRYCHPASVQGPGPGHGGSSSLSLGRAISLRGDRHRSRPHCPPSPPTYLGTMTRSVTRYSESSTKSSLFTMSLRVRVKRFPLGARGTKGVRSAEKHVEVPWTPAHPQRGGGGQNQEQQQETGEAQAAPGEGAPEAQRACPRQNRRGWQGLGRYRQSPEGLLDPTPPSPALPWREPPLPLSGGHHWGQTARYSSVHTAASSRSRLGCPGLARARRERRVALHASQWPGDTHLKERSCAQWNLACARVTVFLAQGSRPLYRQTGHDAANGTVCAVGTEAVASADTQCAPLPESNSSGARSRGRIPRLSAASLAPPASPRGPLSRGAAFPSTVRPPLPASRPCGPCTQHTLPNYLLSE